MRRSEIVQQIMTSGAVAVIRMADSQKLMKVAEAIRKGGVTSLEITMTTPNALQVIETCVREMGTDMLVGVGSVLDEETARLAILAGAQYIVSPVLKEDIIRMAHRYDKAVMPGAFTPTEIITAQEFGADIIKIFPADVVGMPFFKAVKAPMPHVNLMPTGGVSLTNAGQWLKAGACAVGVGSALLDNGAIANEKYDVLTANAKQLCASISEARRES